ncbi:MAG: hypothetical protein HQL32_10145, partial [Planctomycetes bacterium]|nr:hypothetical protein [Planctomycetota bacterium]
YGSSEKGRDKTSLNLMFGEDGMLFEIIDYGGKFFDDMPYHSRKDLQKSQLGGLTLVEAYSDDWEVDIDVGNSTKVTFFKAIKGKDQQD